ncbi:Tm-1-like ATP-binding domain-containing protein [Pseudonocardia sp. DSM 110487]|uniref:Tm-1-like ATP-binding domain-containing protein n=1 Tax=Pseudonocardia sp. DSM 110487 TaxID=2865833 RepID=UPI001C6A51F9|nr:Tm-1-like ATP-binding domain-containing protein [Pseudonocardia sp. DSM 110487]QYN32737.1 Tm-1-like ATP-binding domain-containing protein [Pseudonocardia sp. DSM 110487]
MGPFVAVLATLDTKAGEAFYLRDVLAELGIPTRLVDVGLRPTELTDPDRDIPAEAVAHAAGASLADLREGTRRDRAMTEMAAGAGLLLRIWHGAGQLAGALAIGGSQGTAVAAAAMRSLPYGVPKVIVSTVASGDVRGYVGDSDVTMMFSVADLLGGPNAVTAPVLRGAAAAVAGMVAAGRPAPLDGARPLVATTAFGNTHAAVTTATDRLRAAGVDTVAFHASGACGSAMERLVAEGMFAGVLDLTTHELLGEIEPADIYAPVRPGRLTAAGERGIPQVLVPGGCEYFCFGAADTIPAHLRGRPVHHHNSQNTNVRAGAAELDRFGALFAQRANAATGPTAVLVPLKGWSEVGSPGGILHDPEANAAFVARLRADLAPHVEYGELDLSINDPRLAVEAADALLRHLPTRATATAIPIRGVT